MQEIQSEISAGDERFKPIFSMYPFFVHSLFLYQFLGDKNKFVF